MATLCFLDLRLSLQIFSILRSFTYFSLIICLALLHSKPDMLGQFIKEHLQTNSLDYLILLLLVSVLLSAEFIFLVAIWQQSRPWLVPWLVINALLVASLLALILYNFITVIAPMEEQASLQHRLQTLINSANLLILGHIVNFAAGVRLFMDMRFKRRVSFSRKVMEKKLSKVDMEELEESAYQDFVALPVNEKSQKFAEDLEKCEEKMIDFRFSVGSSKCSDNEDSVMFSFDKNNFA